MKGYSIRKLQILESYVRTDNILSSGILYIFPYLPEDVMS